jgi:hypothetical protein
MLVSQAVQHVDLQLLEEVGDLNVRLLVPKLKLRNQESLGAKSLPII